MGGESKAAFFAHSTRMVESAADTWIYNLIKMYVIITETFLTLRTLYICKEVIKWMKKSLSAERKSEIKKR